MYITNKIILFTTLEIHKIKIKIIIYRKYTKAICLTFVVVLNN